jgi:hypothetical protein
MERCREYQQSALVKDLASRLRSISPRRGDREKLICRKNTIVMQFMYQKYKYKLVFNT